DVESVATAHADEMPKAPEQGADALRIGVASHLGSHEEYTKFMKAKDLEIIARGDQVYNEEYSRQKAANPSDAEARNRAENKRDSFMAKDKAMLDKFANFKVRTCVPEFATRRLCAVSSCGAYR
ncbi:MAG: hypothetical protein ABL907_16590, partial [Hyphomicrobium sp.]